MDYSILLRQHFQIYSWQDNSIDQLLGYFALYRVSHETWQLKDNWKAVFDLWKNLRQTLVSLSLKVKFLNKQLQNTSGPDISKMWSVFLHNDKYRRYEEFRIDWNLNKILNIFGNSKRKIKVDHMLEMPGLMEFCDCCCESCLMNKCRKLL